MQAAAYRARSCLYDAQTGITHDFRRAGVETGKFIASGLLLPETAPDWLTDETLSEQQRRAILWNAVEVRENRKDASLFRDLCISLPRELTHEQNTALLTRFLQDQFAAKGMVADWAFHEEPAGDGGLNPHAHVMLTMREFDPTQDDGWGFKAHRGLPKNRDAPFPPGPGWSAQSLFVQWRQRWADYANEALVAHGHEVRIDPRSYEDQGIDIKPGFPIGKAAAALERDGEETAAAVRLAELKRENAERISDDPNIVLSKVTRQQATFTRLDVARTLHEFVAPYGQRFGRGDGDDNAQEFNVLLEKVMTHDNVITLGHDRKGTERYSTPNQIALEDAIERIAYDLHGRDHHAIETIEGATLRGLSAEQRSAAEHLVTGGDIACLIGKAGSGKTTTLAAVREAYEAEGYNVRGAALAGIAAHNLTEGAGIPSATVASLRHLWAKGEQRLAENDVLVVDEAAMLGARDMFALLDEAHQRNAKIIFVGDAQQLQAIEAGATFRALTERLGASELHTIHRQRDHWQADATAKLARGEVGEAIKVYEEKGNVRGLATKEAALEALVSDWRQDRAGQQSQLMLAHSRADVEALNKKARAALKATGELGDDREFTIVELAEEAGQLVDKKRTRSFANGDRVIFLRNDKKLEVKNGTVGALEEIGDDGAYRIKLDDGRRITSDLHSYGYLDHGYATTVHKAQGVTVERSYIFASGGFDQHLSYVALTRHRDAAKLYWDRETFKDERAMQWRLGRENAKDNVLDYRGLMAARRGFAPVEQTQPPPRAEQTQAPPDRAHAEKEKQPIVAPSIAAPPAVQPKRHLKHLTPEFQPPGFPRPLSPKLKPEPRPTRPIELPKPAPVQSPESKVPIVEGKPEQIRVPELSASTPRLQTQQTTPTNQSKQQHAIRRSKPQPETKPEPSIPLSLNASEGSVQRKPVLTEEQKRALKALDGSQRRAIGRTRGHGRGRERTRDFE